jgi:hypothetical protein
MDEEGSSSNLAGANRALIPHPRRPPAHKSVSLIHSRGSSPMSAESPKRKRQRTPASTKANPGSPVSDEQTSSDVPAQPGKSGSSGESSNAEKWFEKSNNNVRSGSADLMDNDPPFFLRNSSSSETSPDLAKREREREQQAALENLPHRTSLMHLERANSSSEDFRSVIDDLTVQNKKLKKRLKKYERIHDARLQNERLFEIRVHGLAPDKKRELEETLQKFASSLDGQGQTQTNSSTGNSSEQVSTPAVLGQKFSNGDSAYASASGHNSSMQSGQGSNSALRKHSIYGMSNTQQRDIQTYLSDIPAGLMPQAVVMSEKAKRKLIVRRLEQLFAGKGAAKGGHQQPIQQQEISRSAAQADDTARQAIGHHSNKEGAREARIMSYLKSQAAAEASVEPESQTDRRESAASLMPPNVSVKGLSRNEPSPDQRPTRPLDLDPYRAQVPEDNIKYLQHLGFSPLDVGSNEELVDGHGYSYLNVLTNMAQLHTLNVTPEFVKKAVEQYSKKLELSLDGRKVRWKGGNELTRTSSNGSPDDNSNTPGQPTSGGNSSKTGLLSNNSGDGSSESLSKSGKAKEVENKMAYVPLFFHQGDDDDDSEEDTSDWSSPPQDFPAAANSSGFTSSGVRTSSSKKRQGHDGPIIFYNKAPFVTDLSGDYRGADLKVINNRNYMTLPVNPLGSARVPATSRSAAGRDSKGPLSRNLSTAGTPDAMDIDSVGGSISNSLHGFSKPGSLITASSGSSSDDSPDPVEFEASGVGGVHPSDNFSIDVRSRHRLAHEHSSYAGPNSRSKTYPPHIRAILAGSAPPSASSSRAAQNRAIQAEIISSKLKDLPSSELPPPSYFPLTSPEDEDDFSDDEDSESIDEPTFSNPTLSSKIPQIRKWTSEETDSSDPTKDAGAVTDGEADDDDDDAELFSESSSSVDMLAHAREVAPEWIHIAEREYDGTVAERLAEEIPAGSSAATAGGGSGYNSPNSPVGGAHDKGSEILKGLKRARGNADERPVNAGRNSKSPKLVGSQ